MVIYRAIETPMISLSGYHPEQISEVIIVKCSDTKKDTWVPSPLTHYIYARHRTAKHSNNTKLKTARDVCSFLNYITNQIALSEDESFDDLKINGLHSLNSFHLAKYLNYICNKSIKNISYDTAKSKKDNLVDFYKYLYTRNIIKEEANIDNNPDIVIELPNQDRIPSNQLKDMKEDVWRKFLDYAELNYPDIALGVSMQCMGGLRMGEIVNLTVDAIDVEKSRGYMKASIRDRQKLLFRDRNINEAKSQVKRPRDNQPIFNFNGKLFKLWDKQMKFLSNFDLSQTKKALFIDTKKQPMSGSTYEKRFLELKRDFIEYLDSQGYIAISSELRSKSWGSHIGRHIFTNHLIKMGAVNGTDGKAIPRYLAALRGDLSDKSSADYIDTKAVVDVVLNKLEIISDVASKFM
ncbi:tyrosine-type recombinase/integrase [Clostridium baratii]